MANFLLSLTSLTAFFFLSECVCNFKKSILPFNSFPRYWIHPDLFIFHSLKLSVSLSLLNGMSTFVVETFDNETWIKYVDDKFISVSSRERERERERGEREREREREREIHDMLDHLNVNLTICRQLFTELCWIMVQGCKYRAPKVHN